MTDPTARSPEDTRSTLEDDIFGTDAEFDERGPRIIWRRPATLPGCRTVGVAGAGAATFLVVDLIMMWAPLMDGAAHSRLPQALTLAFLAFGLGGLLAWRVRGGWRPYGLGIMIGWAALTLISVGFLTGINP